MKIQITWLIKTFFKCWTLALHLQSRISPVGCVGIILAESVLYEAEASPITRDGVMRHAPHYPMGNNSIMNPVLAGLGGATSPGDWTWGGQGRISGGTAGWGDYLRGATDGRISAIINQNLCLDNFVLLFGIHSFIRTLHSTVSESSGGTVSVKDRYMDIQRTVVCLI